MPPSLDAPTVRTWCRLALAALGRAREEIDAINVYPVADGDTGTNLFLTVESAAQSVEAVFDAHAAADPVVGPTLPEAFRAMSHGALIGARGNSGTILAQLLRGMNEPLTAGTVPDAAALRRALRSAADSAYEAVAHPAEGTMLTVASAAATAAEASPDGLAEVVRAAHNGARAALAATPGQLGVLRNAGVVDAGGLGLVAVLAALSDAVTGDSPTGTATAPGAGTTFHTTPFPATSADSVAAFDVPGDCRAVGGPAFEVIYLLEAPAAAVPVLRDRLDGLGDSLVVVGGDGLWNVHVHVDDVGAAIEAGIEAGRPYRIRVTHFGEQVRRTAERHERAVVALVGGDGMAQLCAQAGATVIAVRPGEQPASGEIAAAIRRARAREVILLPNDTELRHAAGAAVEQARGDGVRVALIPTRSAVQGIAALAVHDPSRRFDEDVVAMTSAAGATHYAEVAVAERESWTMAGVCQAGDVLGLIDGDVAVIGADVADTAVHVLDRMLAAGGEMVTLVLGAAAPSGLAARLESHVRDSHLAVDTVTYDGGQGDCPLLIGVE
ncbi:DAK2 domain-containing protein [Streptomyces cocklensis]|uniref:DhaL domain-containing protein n=1 Tax=Actinacidiphila cocklensis TaxID=887465 RepID=A0A9W4DKK6_9ACTN|nr:DAK2 domain-containing protein [Actinacidiphila cocklensis]MDD1060114.1 DAK2 domain-containing protein [Actinacidiphila cocklensis]CAG6391690.1 DhaL domain-containing protein [Actinacidiphila cocklensis]